MNGHFLVSARDLSSGFQFKIMSPADWKQWREEHPTNPTEPNAAEAPNPIHRKHEIRFSLGNNTIGAIGACVSVHAATRQEGLAQLKTLLTQNGFEDGVKLWAPEGLEDLIVYFNTD